MVVGLVVSGLLVVVGLVVVGLVISGLLVDVDACNCSNSDTFITLEHNC